MHLLIRIVSVFLVAHVLCGCGRPETGIPIGGDFELVLRNADSVLHKPGNLRLYQVNASGHKILVWPYVTGSRIVTDKMVIFNGGLTDDRRWGVYPALFVYRRDTGTLEVSKAISRLALRDLAKERSGKVPEYSFLPVTLTNNEVHLECLQRSAVVADWPAYTNIIVSREDMLKAMDETRARGEKAKYAGVEYLIER